MEMTEIDHHEMRERQERDVATSHALVEAEHALAFEAFVIGRVFIRTGIDFDPLTFIALRIIEASLDGPGDPVDALNALSDFGTVERAVALANGLLGDAA